MGYQSWVLNISGTSKGIMEYSQSKMSGQTLISINNGVCRGLVIDWLKSKKSGNDYWKEEKKAPESGGLLSQQNRMTQGSTSQQGYVQSSVDRTVLDNFTTTELSNVGVTYNQLEVGAEHSSYQQASSRIATKVLETSSRFFILSITGADGAHSIGLYRPWKFIGKSSKIYIFDPNAGEVELDGQAAVSSAISGLKTRVYHNVDMDTSYILWTFKD